jgi:hypothetical protein
MESPPHDDSPVEVYQLRALFRHISPIIWRRILVRNDSTIADLHYTLQIAMGWSDSHLHQFIIYGKKYGIHQPGGLWFSDDPYQIPLKLFNFRLKERFLYEYNFTDNWQLEIRVEKHISYDPKKTYPVCTGGARAAPPEECGGPWAFMALKQKYSLRYSEERLVDICEQEEGEDSSEELHALIYWLHAERFDRLAVNRILKQYASGDEAWRDSLGELP